MAVCGFKSAKYLSRMHNKMFKSSYFKIKINNSTTWQISIWYPRVRLCHHIPYCDFIIFTALAGTKRQQPTLPLLSTVCRANGERHEFKFWAKSVVPPPPPKKKKKLHDPTSSVGWQDLVTQFLVKITLSYKLVAKKLDFVLSKLQISIWKDRATVA